MSIRINPNVQPSKVEMLEWMLERRVVGQDRAIRQFTKAMQKYYVNMHNPGRPIATLLFMGPTGVGKTHVVHALAESLLKNRDAVTRIDCGEFQQAHEVAKLIGAPPGYLGHEKNDGARLKQEKIDEWSHVRNDAGVLLPGMNPNIILFDEIEKAHENLSNILLGIMDSGKLSLGNGSTTDFSRTIMVMTSNLGSKETHGLIKGAQMGFYMGIPSTERKDLDQKIYQAAKDAATKYFKPEFINRIDRLVVFRSLTQERLRQILQLEFTALKRRVNCAPRYVDMKLTPMAVEFLLKEGTSEEYGARELKRVLERYVADPISALIGSNQLVTGDCVTIGVENGELVFDKVYDPIMQARDVPADLRNPL